MYPKILSVVAKCQRTIGIQSLSFIKIASFIAHLFHYTIFLLACVVIRRISVGFDFIAVHCSSICQVHVSNLIFHIDVHPSFYFSISAAIIRVFCNLNISIEY